MSAKYMKLYKVYFRGSKFQFPPAYVIATDAESAYVTAELAISGVGFPEDRAMDRVELLAENASYPACGYPLLFADNCSDG